MKKILVVEDEAIAAKLLTNFLSREGYEVLDVIKNGNYVTKAVKKNNPDLILMDIMLQGKKDGITAMKEVREFSKVPVIYISGYSDDKTIKNALETGSSNYFTKPYKSRELAKAIKRVFDKNLENE